MAEASSITIILAGQSNMSGRAGLERVGGRWTWTANTTREAASLGLLSPTHGIQMLEVENPSETDKDSPTFKWVPAVEPMHATVDTKKTCGVGPGLLLAKNILASEHHDVDHVRLVPCAVGETRIEEWQPGSVLYERLIKHGTVELPDVMIWYQGESDSLNEADADRYENRLLEFLHSVRRDLRNPNLEIVVVVPIGVTTRLPYIQKVQSSILGAVLRDPLKQTKIVHIEHSKGQILREDGVHLTLGAQTSLASQLLESIKFRKRPCT
mmetsp:Transcript_4283/g.9264  ORF Transcript_4283/g.9264 Transcript_4283/m.9264 type:complete len:268 (+) Transcript_4283:293-1096(+)|eukprot:CAMPEP_0171516288 /NCGR_PEP_ID=MMETSP0959-20130129/3951_1 /TAXON_ID=87120 /ORGANISM="Aurantiochytrium limacinum, Strain ATCCMYA-1381" /LENGTH=267 /DNA_ID=CAMNT_0012054977 /DNA_START=259 /DNA_END=1062 /DNA_ORIENTATION=-